MFPAMNRRRRQVPLLWSGKKSLELAFYKHLRPYGTSEPGPVRDS